jgi:tetratricopeptide (TPR) repeat protein
MSGAATSTALSQEGRWQLAAACLLNAGQPAEAEALARSRLNQDAGVGLRFYLGLACADQQKLEEAIAALQEVLQAEPDHQDAKAALQALLHKQAVRKANARDWAGAAQALGELCAVSPGAKEAQALLARVESFTPVVCLLGDRREEAAQAWEEAQRGRVEDGRLAHCLALLYSFWGIALEREGQGGEKAQPIWRKAIANRVLTGYDERFWAEWAAERRAAYQFPEAALTKLRQWWLEELERRFRERAEACRAAGEEAEAALAAELEIESWLERTTACALAELRKARCPRCGRMAAAVPKEGGGWVCGEADCDGPMGQERPHTVVACGPIMLKQAGLLEQARSLAASARGLPNGSALTGDLAGLSAPVVKSNADVLSLCLSPWGRAFALAARHRHEEAIAALESDLRRRGSVSDRQGGVLMLYVCLEHGKQLAAAVPELGGDPDEAAIARYLEHVQQALAVWQKALLHREADAGLADQLAREVEFVVVRTANLLKQASVSARGVDWRKELALLTHAVETLRSGMELVRRERIVATLSAMYCEIGTRHRTHGESPTRRDLDASVGAFEDALQVTPDADQVKKLAAVSYNQRGKHKCEIEGDLHGALRDFERAVELDPSEPVYRKNREIVQRAIWGMPALRQD